MSLKPEKNYRPSPEKIREINDSQRYPMWSVFQVVAPLPEDRAQILAEATEFFSSLESEGVVVRGLYDVAGMRADADLMIWWHSEQVEQVQGAYKRFRHTELGRHLEPVWSQVACHRPAEFNKSHVPAFLADERARAYACVYPFVRSLEWYLLPDEERRDLLVEHGKMARDYPDVRANTVPAFALGDYEWLLCFEADELHRIVDLMRHLRGAAARRHTREEIPFFTGPRIELEQLVATLP